MVVLARKREKAKKRKLCASKSGFRDMTTDIDALIHAACSMKEAINRVGDRFDLPFGWLNAEFTKTESYSPKLAEFLVYYKTWSNVLTVRTVAAEYLIAMKLCSGRQYKSDLSDVIGILYKRGKRGTPIDVEQIRKKGNLEMGKR